MAWTTMHFAVGMASSGAITGIACYALRRGWRWIPAAMTLGGIWALIPDIPRLFREDFPNLPMASILGRSSIEHALHRWGDLFFFHRALDAQPHELALHGLIVILLLYNLSIVMLMYLEHKQCNSPANRAWHEQYGIQFRKPSGSPRHRRRQYQPHISANHDMAYRVEADQETHHSAGSDSPTVDSV